MMDGDSKLQDERELLLGARNSGAIAKLPDMARKRMEAVLGFIDSGSGPGLTEQQRAAVRSALLAAAPGARLHKLPDSAELDYPWIRLRCPLEAIPRRVPALSKAMEDYRDPNGGFVIVRDSQSARAWCRKSRIKLLRGPAQRPEEPGLASGTNLLKLLKGRHDSRALETLDAAERADMHAILWESERMGRIPEAVQGRVEAALKKLGCFKPPPPPFIEVPDLKQKLMPYQKEGVAFVDAKGGRALIGDEPGLGKSCQALAWIWLRRSSALPALILCPASIKFNWRNEISKFTWLDRVQTLSGLKPGAIDREADIVIANYDILSRRDSSGWLDALLTHGFKTVVADEVHLVSNRKALSAQAVYQLSKRARHFIALSGTPVVNRPREFYLPAKMVDDGLFSNFYLQFALKFCAARKRAFKLKTGRVVETWDDSGSSNAEELSKLLKARIMVRRLKSDVLPDLPELTNAVETVELGAESRSEYDELLLEMDAPAGDSVTPSMIGMLDKLRMSAMRGKSKACSEWVQNFLLSGQKLLIFAWHIEALDIMEAAVKDYGFVRIDGSTPTAQREKLVGKFQGDEGCQVFLGQIKAAGVGINLTAASHVAFFEMHWSPKVNGQCVDRARRIGQKSAVTAWRFIAKDTIDEHVLAVNDSKEEVIDAIVDGRQAGSGGSKLLEIYNSIWKSRKAEA